MLSAGFAAYPEVFDAGEAGELLREIECAPLARTRAGARHLMSLPVVAEFAANPRLTRIAREWLGTSAVPFRATLFDKSSDANWLVAWHQDTALPVEAQVEKAGWGPWLEKAGILYAHAPAAALERVIALRIHFDDSRDDNGPLRVLPGTHEQGVLTHAQVQECARRGPAATCCVGAGGILAMRPLIVHASSKATNQQPRRILHVEYAPSLRVADGVDLRLA